MLVAVVGATGTGKSEFSLDLAEASASAGIPAEIINADAMQLYRGMDIGTAKLTQAERRGVPHHLLDVLEVTEDSTVAAYQPLARAAITAVLERGHRAILVGGSGLYVSSVMHDFRFPGTDPVLRAELEDRLAREGAAPLWRELESADADAARRIDAANGRRVVRALEILRITGEPYAASLPEIPRPWRNDQAIVHLRRERADLLPLLDERVRRIWSSGMLTEVDALRERGIEHGTTARQAIGYAQALRQLAGESDEATAIEETASLTRRYARRQISWFGRYPDQERVDAADTERRRESIAALIRPTANGRRRHSAVSVD